MAKLQCIPEAVTLSCKKATSITKVRVRTPDKKKDVLISALGYDPVIVLIKATDDSAPENWKTNDRGFFEFFIKCVDEGPCPATTVITFDADDYETCTLTVTCTDQK